MSVHRDESPPAVDDAASPIDEAAIAAVRSALERDGPGLLFDPAALDNLLHEDGTTPAREIALLLRAQVFEIPQGLMSAHTAAQVDAAMTHLSARLVDEGLMSTVEARRAVASWARILGVSGAREDIATAIPESMPVHVAPFDRRHAPGAFPVSHAALSRVHASIVFEALGALLILALVLWFTVLRPSLKIDAVRSSGDLIADGSDHDVTIAFEARRAAVRSVEVHPVDGEQGEAARSYPIAPEAATGKIATTRIAIRSDEPGRKTYRYVLVGNDGTRSAPFDRAFVFAPGPPRPPIITTVSVPPDLVAGKPFKLGIAYEPGSRGLAQVEMRVASSTIPWHREVITLASSAPASATGDTVAYPFEGGLQASRTMVDFTMIDQDGVRSEPRRVMLDVRAPVAVASCTRTTCGRVVATRAIEPSTGLAGFFRRLFVKDDQRARRTYAIVVKRDDGSVRTLNDTTRWNAGARVRIVGSGETLRCVDGVGRCS